MSKKSLLKDRVNNVKELIDCLNQLKTGDGSDNYLEDFLNDNMTFDVELIEETLTDGSRVHNIRITPFA